MRESTLRCGEGFAHRGRSYNKSGPRKDIVVGAEFRAHPARARGQRGIALVVALILLVVITLVGLAAVRGTLMQQKMTSNFYDRQIAFQLAEAALRQGEMAVQASASPSAFYDCSPGGGNFCLPDPLTDTNVPAADLVTVPAASFDPGALAIGHPQYVVEYLGNFALPKSNVTQLSNCSGYAPCGQTVTADFYRITARSGAADVQDRASVVLQSVYQKK